MDKTKTISGKFNCLECENEVTPEASLNVGDYLECPFCGIEFEITAKDAGEFEVKVVEEEK